MKDLSNGNYESETSISLIGELNESGYYVNDTELILQNVKLSNSKSITFTILLDGIFLNGDIFKLNKADDSETLFKLVRAGNVL